MKGSVAGIKQKSNVVEFTLWWRESNIKDISS